VLQLPILSYVVALDPFSQQSIGKHFNEFPCQL
jgi:hypothetical protein